jgi:hypothetical protein
VQRGQHSPDPERYAASLAHAAIAAGDATGWFEQLYADAADGKTSTHIRGRSGSDRAPSKHVLTAMARAVPAPGRMVFFQPRPLPDDLGHARWSFMDVQKLSFWSNRKCTFMTGINATRPRQNAQMGRTGTAGWL